VLERTRDGVVETRYYISSRDFAGNQRLLFDAIRQHWSIENKLHYRRDATYNEDKGRIRKLKQSRALCTLRNLCIGLYEMRKHVFTNYRFKSMPAMHEHFAARSDHLFRWMQEANIFVL
jgi:hypothetical protein